MPSFLSQFGRAPSKSDRAAYETSPNYKDGKFSNLFPTEVDPAFSKIPGILYRQLTDKTGVPPKRQLPVAAFDKEAFLSSGPSPHYIWYGHSALLLRMADLTILIDPMLGPDASPIAPIKTKRFSDNTLDLIDQFPPIDLALITHDHYDHIDLASIEKLKHKVGQWWVALGAKRHFKRWGIDEHTLTEFDWWQEQRLGDLKVTFTPTQHFSGRGLRDRMQCLWGGWMLDDGNQRVWFSGDGGYNEHFKLIGERFESIDFAFMECGQYNTDWHPVHLFPEEAVQAALDANVKVAVPVHWAGFSLSYYHKWHEPPEVFVKSAEANNLRYSLPQLGALNTIKNESTTWWWKELV